MNILIMLLLISLLVLVHEIGHYLAARAFGITVSKFGFGMPIGPTLFKKKFGDTTVIVHAFLLGGYVSFIDDEEKDDEDAPDLPKDSPQRYSNKKPWQKAVVLSAGVIFNILFAIVLTIFCAIAFQKLPSQKLDVYIDSFATNASKSILASGIKAGDQIIKVNGQKINSSSQFIFMIQKSKYYDGFVDIKTYEKKLAELKKINPSLKDDIKKGAKVHLPVQTPENALSVTKNELMGLEKHKTSEIELSAQQKNITKEIDNKRTYIAKEDCRLSDIAYAISDSYKPLTISILRNNKEYTYKNIRTTKDGLLGVKLKVEEIFVPIKNIKDAVTKSFTYLYDNTKIMILGLVLLFTGKIPMSDMHGIVAITKVGGDIIEHSGILKGLLLTAIISIDLALINLLPIPALDGGHLMFLLIEKITGRKLNEDVVENISKVFFMLLIALMIYVVFNDIFALITKKL